MVDGVNMVNPVLKKNDKLEEDVKVRKTEMIANKARFSIHMYQDTR